MFFRSNQRFSAVSSSKWYGACSFSMNKSRKFAALILIAIILSAFSGTLYAQDVEDDDEPHGLYVEKPRIFYGGLLIGSNFSQVDGDFYAGYRKTGMNVGGIMYAQLAKHAAVSLEILYSQKGSTSNGAQISPANGNVVVLQYRISNNYAEIPVMVNYFDKRKSHFGVGVSYGRLVNSSEVLHENRYDTAHAIWVYRNVDLTKYPFKKDAFDILAGVEMHLWKGLFLNVRFQYSLTPIRTELPPAEYARANQHNNMWVVRLMYLLK
jgi:Outer membrane protein beta-barrel domain